MNYLAGPTEQNLLHMITGDPRRTPSFIMFANPNYFLDATSSSCPPGAAQPGCVAQFQGDAYNHGDVGEDINRTWIGFVGPGVRSIGETASVWSDHTDDRPTILQLLGLKDDYAHEGRVITQVLDPSVIPSPLRTREALKMARVFKQLEAPVGAFGLDTLSASTGALAAGDPGDAIYNQCNAQLVALGKERDATTLVMSRLFEGAEFNHQGIDRFQARSLALKGEQILNQALTTKEWCT